MQTPGDEIQYVAGFCLGEWLVDSPDDFASLAFSTRQRNIAKKYKKFVLEDFKYNKAADCYFYKLPQCDIFS